MRNLRIFLSITFHESLDLPANFTNMPLQILQFQNDSLDHLHIDFYIVVKNQVNDEIVGVHLLKSDLHFYL